MRGQSDDFRKVLRVFIASPGDLGEERRLFRDIVDEVNRSKANGMGTQLEPLGWEDTLPGYGRPQELINEDVKKCDLMIMLLWKRWGTPTGEYSSGFEEEYELAKRLLEEEGKPEIMLYFRKIPDNMLADPGEQLQQVLKFKEKIESERKFLYKSYEDENRWESIFREHLSKWLDRLLIEDYRNEESIEDQRKLNESEDEFRRLKNEIETERQNSQTAIKDLALTLGIEALEKADSGQITRAEEYFAKSIANYPNPSIINSYGLFLQRIGMLENAEERFLQVAEIGKETGDDSLVAIAYGNLGNVYMTRGDLDRAEEMYEKSLAINKELGRKEGMASQYGNLGNVYQIRGDLDKAEAMYGKSLAINEELGRKEGVASQYGNLGNVYQIRGDLDKAEAMYGKSLAINKELGRRAGMASDYGNLGIVCQIRGDLDKAEAMYRKSLAINKELGRREGMANQYGNLGNLYESHGDISRAEAMYRKSLAIIKELGRKEGVASQYGNLGDVYQIRGDLDRAEEMYEKSLVINEELGRREGLAKQYARLGNVYQIRGDLDKAEAMYEKSLELFISIGSEPMIEKLESVIDGVSRQVTLMLLLRWMPGLPGFRNLSYDIACAQYPDRSLRRANAFF